MEDYKLLSNLNKLMVFHNVSAYRLAKCTNRTTSTITRYLKLNDPSYLPSTPLIEDIARYFGFSRNDLLFTDIDPEKANFEKIPEAKEPISEARPQCPVYNSGECMRLLRKEDVPTRERATIPDIKQRSLDAKMFAYHVLGNAYAPTIKHGDITFCYFFNKEMSLREGTVLLVGITPKDYSEPILTFGELYFGDFGEKNLRYQFEGKARTIPINDSEILGVVAVNCTEFI